MLSKNTLFIFFLFFAVNLYGQKIILTQAGPACFEQKTLLTLAREGTFPNDDSQVLVNADTKVILGTFKNDSVYVKLSASTKVYAKSSKTELISNEVGLTIKPYFGAFIDYESEAVCEGFERRVEIYTGLEAQDIITWYRNDTLDFNLSGSTIQVNKGGNYTAKVNRNECIYDVFGSAIVRIGQLQKPEINTLGIPLICQGSTYTLSGAFEDINGLGFQWKFENANISGANATFINVNKEGKYTFEVTQGDCKAESAPIFVKTGSLPKPLLSSGNFSIGNDTLQICEGLSTTLALSNFKGHAGLSYEWFHDNKPYGKTAAITVKDSGAYQLRIHQGVCQNFSDKVYLKHGDIKGISLSTSLGINNFCEGHAAELQLNFTNNSFFNAVTNLQLFDQTGFNQNIPFTFSRTPVQKNGTYYVKGKFGAGNCQIVSNPLKLTFFENTAPIDFLKDINAIQKCEDSLLLQIPGSIGNADDSEIHWFLNEKEINVSSANLWAKTSGKYYFEITDKTSCKYVSSKLEVQIQKISGTIVPKYDALCSNNIAELVVKLGDDQTKQADDFFSQKQIQVTWAFDGDSLSNEKSILATEKGVYQAQIIMGNCSASTPELNLDIEELNFDLTPTTDSLFICPGGKQKMKLNSDFEQNIWLKNGSIFKVNQPEIEIDSAGTYQVWVENSGCFGFSDTKVAKEKIVLPTAKLSGDGDINFGESVTLQIDFTGQDPWTFNLPSGESVTTSENPYLFDIVPFSSEVYAITTVKNDCGFGQVEGLVAINLLILGSQNAKNTVVYPVPTHDRLIIENQGEANCHILDLQGRLMKSKSLLAGKNELDLSSLPSGKYLLKIEENQALTIFQILKN